MGRRGTGAGGHFIHAAIQFEQRAYIYSKEKLLATAAQLLQDEDGYLPEQSLLEHNFAELQDNGRLVCEYICRRDAVYLNPMHEAEVLSRII